jgi:radical SAM protein with 4Fe4S-binding SPASM domain
MIKLLDELGPQNIRTLELGGGGEPLDHPEIGTVLELFAARGFRVGLITNGYRFVTKPRLVEPLMLCADWIRFSMDAVSDSVYREVHGRDDLSYQALRETISAMATAVRKYNGLDQRPKIGAKLIVQRPNQHQVLAAVDEAEALGLHYLQFKWLEEHPQSVPFADRPAITAALQNRIAQIPPGSLTVDVLPGYGGSRVQGRCLMSVLHPLVDWDGTVYLCAFFHHRKAGHSIGNITNQSFFDCWGSEQHRDQIRRVDPQQCVPNCPLLRYNPVIEFIIREHFRFHYI